MIIMDFDWFEKTILQVISYLIMYHCYFFLIPLIYLLIAIHLAQSFMVY
jgi:hypothetical protein